MTRAPYARYKPSGVEWLGDVPEHWEVKRSDGIIESEKNQLSPESFADEEVFHYSIPAVQEFGTSAVENGETIASSKQSVVEPVVLVSRLNPRKATICRAEPKAQRTLASTEFVALKARKCDLRFLEYLVSSETFRQRLDSWVQSVTRSHQRASPDLIYRFWSAWPHPDEQRAIADFLDRETSRLDQLIAKKRELIERLKEKRTALISRTVTRGLPADAAAETGLPVNPPLKPSGLDWLGDIPGYWEVCRLKRVTLSRCDGPFGSGLKSEHYCDDGVRVIRLQNIRFAQFDDRDAAFIEPEYYKELGDHSVLPGDLLIAGLGDENHPVGRACVAPSNLGPAMVKADCFRFRLNPKRATSSYVALQLSTTANALAGALATGTTRGRMNLSATEDREIALPPLPEQAAIAAYLDVETAKLDALVVQVEEAVERLQEYRTALITAAVTGKIDVRQAALDGGGRLN